MTMIDPYFQFTHLPIERRGGLYRLRELVIEPSRFSNKGQIIHVYEGAPLPAPVEFWIDPDQIESLVTAVDKTWVLLREAYQLEAKVWHAPHSVLRTKTGDVKQLLGGSGDVLLALQPWSALSAGPF